MIGSTGLNCGSARNGAGTCNGLKYLYNDLRHFLQPKPRAPVKTLVRQTDRGLINITVSKSTYIQLSVLQI